MTTFTDDSVTWEFNAPRYFNLQHQEEFSTQWNDSWFKESRSESSQTRINRRLRAPRILPEPSRPISSRSTAAPSNGKRDIFAALAAAQKSIRPLAQKTEERATHLPTQKAKEQTHPPTQKIEERTTGLPEQKAEEKTKPRARFAQPTAASLSKTRATGQRDVATEIKRITSRFAKKPTDKASTTSSERSFNRKGKDLNRRPASDDKENVPPYQHQDIPSYHDLSARVLQKPSSSVLSGLSDYREAVTETITVDGGRLEPQEAFENKGPEQLAVPTSSVDEIPHLYHGASSVIHQSEEEVSHREDGVMSTVDQGYQPQHKQTNPTELDKELLDRINAITARTRQELTSPKKSINVPIKDNGPSDPITPAIVIPNRQSRVSQQETSLTNTTILVGRERMRQWLDDQTAGPTTEELRSEKPAIEKSTTPTKENTLQTQIARSPEQSRSEPLKSQPVLARPRPKSGESHNIIATPTDFDALFERMNVVRSQLLQVAETSAIKPMESDMTRNKKRWEGPIKEVTNLQSSDYVGQQIARARRVIEDSKRHSQKWFFKDPSKPVPPIMAPVSKKRKSLVEDARPKKFTKTLDELSSELHNALSRRESMDNIELSVAERVEKLRQSTSHRASRVSTIRSVYLPIAPTVPKSPAFATDARSRMFR